MPTLSSALDFSSAAFAISSTRTTISILLPGNRFSFVRFIQTCRKNNYSVTNIQEEEHCLNEKNCHFKVAQWNILECKHLRASKQIEQQDSFGARYRQPETLPAPSLQREPTHFVPKRDARCLQTLRRSCRTLPLRPGWARGLSTEEAAAGTSRYRLEAQRSIDKVAV